MPVFQPLTYQVSTAALSPDEIAEPLRRIFRRDGNVRVLMGEVEALDLDRRLVMLRPEFDGLAQRRTAPFRYRDRGRLATIGRARAVADLRRLRLAGFPAWVIWLAIHLLHLVGFENRVVVLDSWAYNFFTHGRGGRLITHS